MVGDVAVVAPRPATATTWIGRALPRLEDQRLVLGQGEYTDDITTEGELHAVIVRSPFAHARIRRIDVAQAYAAPGVLGVYTGLDYQNDGRGPIHQNPMPDDNLDGGRPAFSAEEGALLVDVPQQVLAVSEVFHQGEAVVLVVADTKAHALDAAELVDVSYDELPVIVEIDQALAPGAIELVTSAPNNIVVDAQRGDGEATERAFAGADAIVEGEFHNQRIFSAHMEPRSALATYDSVNETFDVVCGGGGSVRYRRVLGTALKVPIESIQVRTPDVGGSFGSRNNLHPEVVLVAWAAMRLGRAVRWTSTRSDGFLTDFPGRDMHVKSELALTADGKILAMRALATANVGAYTISYAFLNNYSRIAPSVYDIPAADIHVRAVLTNTTPLTVYRGAGRPEAMFVIERLLDLAAAKLGLSRLEIRRRNIIKAKPYTSATGLTYDSGDFIGNMQRVLDLADWDGFPLRRTESASRNRLRGIGLANYVEAPTGFPRERVVINVLPEGVVEVLIGTQSSGQSHETTFAQIVAELLDVPIRSVRLVQGDTRRVDVGGGTHSNRSMRLGSTLLVEACREIRAMADAASGGAIRDLFRIAETTPLSARADVSKRMPAYPTGSAVCEVEIDPRTGEITPVAYTQVDDAGRPINPLVLHGQTHGGIAQGLGQAFMEAMVYDRESGQILSGSFMGYAMPRARHFPALRTELVEDRTFGNVMHIKGGGEAGITPSPAAAVSAVVDALRAYGVTHIEMPVTAVKVWRIISEWNRIHA
jgi:aerobic carbon-monoxide dehydrogenase large subunit